MTSSTLVVRDEVIADMDEVFKVRVETEHRSERYGAIRACTSVHDQLFARRIGGVRFVKGPPPEEDRLELHQLASAMTWKCALSGLPVDGEKTVVYCSDAKDSEDLPDESAAAKVLSEHLEELTAVDGGVIFGPDIRCGEGVMTMLAEEFDRGEHVSGLKKDRGGLSIDRHGYTAFGLLEGLLVVTERLGWDLSSMRATVQGFGAVGAHIARNLAENGVTIAAVSTVSGALIADSDSGLPIDALFRTYEQKGDEAFKHYKEAPPPGCHWADRDDLFKVPAEIFVPAARTSVLAMPDELAKYPDSLSVCDFIADADLRMVLEGANHPLSDRAEKYVEAQGIYVLPDYLVNCGGLIGCWIDWLYRSDLGAAGRKSRFEELDQETRNSVKRIVTENVSRLFDRTNNAAAGTRDETSKLARDRRQSLQQGFEACSGDLAGASDGGRAVYKLFLRKLFDEEAA